MTGVLSEDGKKKELW